MLRYRAAFERLFDQFDIAHIASLSPSQVADIFAAKVVVFDAPARGTRLTPEQRKLAKENLGAPLRYLAGPPISDDDLAVLAEVTSTAPAAVRADPDGATRILRTILQALDTTRFPWVAEGRGPTEPEKATAIATSAALITAQRISTDRRNEGKEAQEKKVRTFLVDMGFTAVPPRPMPTLEAAPARGAFCAESMVGSRKADVPVRLFDGRLMPIECKVSNSELNSFKRINNDAAVKAVRWRHELGANQVVPVAMLAGVFKVSNLLAAQAAGLTLFWSHDLDAMKTFIETTGQA